MKRIIPIRLKSQNSNWWSHPSDTMEKKATMVLIAVIVVVAVVAVAAFVMMGGSSSDKYSINGSLNVYGNADGDYKIDQKDIGVIEDVIDGKKTLAQYPFADANTDGVVNQKDIDLVNKIINKQNCTVYIVNQKKTAGEYISTVKWPIKSAITAASSNMLLLFEFSGLTDQIKGISFTSSSDPALEKTIFGYYATITKLGTSSTAISIDAATDTINKYNVTAVIADYTDSTLSNEAAFVADGIDVIRVSAAVTDPDKYASQIMLMSFLFNTQSDAIYEYAEWNTKVINDITKKLEKVKEKATVIACNGAISSSSGTKRIWVSAGSSDYKDVVETAGATYAITDEFLKTISTYTSGAYFNEGDTWVYQLNPSSIISIRTGAWYEGNVDPVKMFEESLSIFDKTQAWETDHVAVIAGDAPITVRIAYAAAILYPNLFSMEWADGINKEAMNKFYPEEVNLDGKYFCITKEVYNALKNKA